MDTPMGVSQWMEHGKKYSYDEFWFKKILGDYIKIDTNGRLVKFCPKCDKEIIEEMQKDGLSCDRINPLIMIEEALGDVGFDASCKYHLNPETLTEQEIEFAKVLIEVYKIAHGFNDENGCYSSHDDWREEAKKKYDH